MPCGFGNKTLILKQGDIHARVRQPKSNDLERQTICAHIDENA